MHVSCFIRGVDQDTIFFPWHFEQANTILHRLREGKIPFVLCQHKHFNLRLSLLSKQQISSEAQETEETHVGPSISPSSAEAQLILHGLCVLSVSEGMHKSKGEERVQVCQLRNSHQDQRSHFCCVVLQCCFMWWAFLLFLHSILYNDNHAIKH